MREGHSRQMEQQCKGMEAWKNAQLVATTSNLGLLEKKVQETMGEEPETKNRVRS